MDFLAHIETFTSAMGYVLGPAGIYALLRRRAGQGAVLLAIGMVFFLPQIMYGAAPWELWAWGVDAVIVLAILIDAYLRPRLEVLAPAKADEAMASLLGDPGLVWATVGIEPSKLGGVAIRIRARRSDRLLPLTRIFHIGSEVTKCLHCYVLDLVHDTTRVDQQSLSRAATDYAAIVRNGQRPMLQITSSGLRTVPGQIVARQAQVTSALDGKMLHSCEMHT